MTDWFEGLGGREFATAVTWTFAALILLVIVLVIIRLIRSLTFGTFVAGGRNRKTRLAVMDATAVDSHRRLVLVRRDDIEHLLLIGGPTDVVVEREIRLGQTRRSTSVFAGENAYEAPAPTPAPVPAAPAPVAALPPVRQRAPEPMSLPPLPLRASSQPPPPRQPERAPQPPPRQPERPVQPVRGATRQTGARPPVREAAAPPPRTNPARLPPATLPAAQTLAPGGMSTTIRQQPLQPPQQPVRANSLDDALLRELEVTFDAGPPKKPAKPVEMTLDDEMTKLLGELSNNKR